MTRTTFQALALGLSRSDLARTFAEPGVAPNYGPSWTYRPVKVSLLLELYPEEQRWTGRAAWSLEAYPGSKGVVAFDLVDVTVQAVYIDDVETTNWAHDGRRLTVRGLPTSTVVSITFAGKDPRVGLYFVGASAAHPDREWQAWTQCQDEDARYIFPCFDHPGVKHAWSIKLTGPAAHTLLSNGQRVDSGTEDGRGWSTFEQAEPMPAYLFSAVSAALDVVQDTVTIDGQTLDVRYAVPAGRSDEALPAMGKTPQMMTFLSDWSGVAYPWPRYDQVVVHDFVFGGMENTACTTMMERLLCDDATRLHTGMDGLVIHELAHQWFGDLVTCQDWSQAWLNEAFATFSEQIWSEEVDEANEALWTAWSHFEAYKAEDAGRYRRPIASYLFREPIDLFDRHLYEKGAMVLRTLRAELGDEAFRSGVTAYLKRYAHGVAHGRDLQRAMEETTGRNLDRFFHQWILGAGHPTLEVAIEPQDNDLRVSVKQLQTGDDVAEAFAFGLPLDVVTTEGETRSFTLRVDAREATLYLPDMGDVTSVRVDPELTVAAEIRLSGPEALRCGLAKDPSPVLAVRALRSLAKQGGTRADNALQDALRAHPFWGVRAEAAGLLAKQRSQTALLVLCEALNEEREPRALAAIAKALGAFRQVQAADTLEGLLEDGTPDAHVLSAVLEALGKTRASRAVSILKDHLHIDSWGDVVRGGALRGLAETRDKAALEVIQAWLSPKRGVFARIAAAGALGILGKEVESVQKTCAEALVDLLHDGQYRVVLSAIKALRALGHASGIAALRLLRQRSSDGRIARMCFEAITALEQGDTAQQGVMRIQRELESQRDLVSTLKARLDGVSARVEGLPKG